MTGAQPEAPATGEGRAGTSESELEPTPEEMIMVELARTIDNGDVVNLGNFTLLSHGAACLAALTHAPDVVILQEAGYGIRPYRKTLTTGGNVGTTPSIFKISLMWGMNYMHQRGVSDVECISPAQIDVLGNTNTSLIGDPLKPTVRLTGGAGAGAVQQVNAKNIVYTARHSKRVLVPKVDFITGGRYFITAEERIAKGLRPGVMKLITNLCTFTMNESIRRLELTSIHPGISFDQVRESTGWDVGDGAVPTTPAPSQEQIRLLRYKIDPLNVLAMEAVPSRDRVRRVREMVANELGYVAETSTTSFGKFVQSMGVDRRAGR